MNSQERIKRILKLAVSLSVDKCSNRLSKFLKKAATIEFDKISYRKAAEITTTLLNQEDKDVSASYIDFVGDLPFKFLFYVNMNDAMTLTDLILRKEVGTTQEYNIYCKSAVQEISNILASVCTNVFVTDFDISLRPSTPALVRGKLKTVLREYIYNVVADDQEVLLMETVFNVTGYNIRCYMFIIPVAQTEKILEQIVSLQ